MIDVLKRLAELDATNPNVVQEEKKDKACPKCGETHKGKCEKDLKESTEVAECGPMGMMGGAAQHHSPATINMTADSGSELTGMLRDIMQLAGLKQVGAQDLGVAHEPMSLTAEPVVAVGPAAAEPVNSMRSVLDKLHPEEPKDDLGPFQHDDGEADDEEDEEEETDEAYDNTPEDPTNPPPVDADEYAHHENQPGSGDDEKGNKRMTNLPTATYESLMKEYKEFIGESEETTVEENTQELTNESVAEETTEESTDESIDILKLAGLK